jgi:hypothetical protein
MALSQEDLAIRPDHIWAGEAGQIAAGKAGKVFMVKTGQKSLTTLAAMRL